MVRQAHARAGDRLATSGIANPLALSLSKGESGIFHPAETPTGAPCYTRMRIHVRGVPTVPLDAIVVKGAREHNLKNIDVTIPRDKLVVITGAVRLGQVVRSPSTRSTPKVSAVMSSRSRPTPASSSARWRSRTSTTSRGSRPRSRSTRRARQPQPALDRRHRHRDLRLPAPALRARRPAALPQVRPADRAADGAADRRRHPGDRRPASG